MDVLSKENTREQFNKISKLSARQRSVGPCNVCMSYKTASHLDQRRRNCYG